MRAGGRGSGGKRRRGQPGPSRDSQGSGVNGLVGDIVLTHQETVSRVAKCVKNRGQMHRMLRAMGPDSGHGMRHLNRRRQGRAQAGPHAWHRAGPRPANLDRLGSLWAEMRREHPEIMASEELIAFVSNSYRRRNAVAHARRTCEDAAIRNDGHSRTYGRGELERYLSDVRAALDHVRRLYDYLNLGPLE